MPLTELLLAFGDEVLDAVKDAKAIGVEDVRAAMLDPLRRRLAGMRAEEGAAAVAGPPPRSPRDTP